jgi:microcystin-dependent protein
MALSKILTNSIASGAIPDSTSAGTVSPWGGTSTPTGWLLCDGTAVSRSTYSALFTAIGTTYGTGDGSSTFNIPDLRGRTVCGKDNMGGSAANRLTSGSTIDGSTLGTAGGGQTHTLSQAQLPSHRHGSQQRDGSTNDYVGGSGANYGLETTSNVNNILSTAIGSGTAHANVQPSIVLNYIIKT